MTLSRCHSFKIQSTNLKLKTNFKSKTNTIITCQQSVELPIEHVDEASNKNNIYRNRVTNAEINLEATHANNIHSMAEQRIQSSTEDILSMAPNINKKIRLTITPMHVQSRRGKRNIVYYNKLRRSTTQPKILRSWFNWFRLQNNAAFYSPPLEHPTKGIEINIQTNDNPNRVRTVVNVGTVSSNDDEDDNDQDEISNSSLKNVDPAALKDELATYMEEIRAREKR